MYVLSSLPPLIVAVPTVITNTMTCVLFDQELISYNITTHHVLVVLLLWDDLIKKA